MVDEFIEKRGAQLIRHSIAKRYAKALLGREKEAKYRKYLDELGSILRP